MNVAIVFSAFGGDAPLLRQALRAIPRLRAANPQDRIDAFVLDDAAHPLPEAPEGVRYARTAWNRGGNLTGLENMRGMAEELARIGGGGYDWIVKTDCDTFLNSLDWLRACSARGLALAGTMTAGSHFCRGICYALTPALARKWRAQLASPAVQARIRRGKGQEDVCFTRLAYDAIAKVYAFTYAPAAPEAPCAVFAWRTAGRAPADIAASHYAATFKRCTMNKPPEQKSAFIEEAAERMKAYADALCPPEPPRKEPPQCETHSKPSGASSAAPEKTPPPKSRAASSRKRKTSRATENS